MCLAVAVSWWLYDPSAIQSPESAPSSVQGVSLLQRKYSVAKSNSHDVMSTKKRSAKGGVLIVKKNTFGDAPQVADCDERSLTEKEKAE